MKPPSPPSLASQIGSLGATPVASEGSIKEVGMPTGFITIALLLLNGFCFLKLYHRQEHHDPLTLFIVRFAFGSAAFFAIGELYTLIRYGYFF